MYSHCIRDPPKNLQELYQLFEKYARSEELHQCKAKSQRKHKDPPQSSRTWTRPAQPDSGLDNRNHQQVHNIANQHPAGETTRRQEDHPKAATTTQEEEVTDGHNSHADSTACFMAKTAHTQQGIVRRPRPLGTECPEHIQPTTRGSSRTHTINSNPTTMSKSSIHPTTLTSTIKSAGST
jgi:hypothetical protein